MTYRKFKADYLFTGREMADEDSVLITTEDGTVQDILPFSQAGEGVEKLRGLLCPGFINCHCHMELSHLRGVLPERTGLVDFLLAVIQQRNSLPPGLSVASGPGPAEFIQAAIADAGEYMLRDGIVAVGDICNTTHSLAQKRGGLLYYHNFIETMGFVEQSAPDRFENSRKIFGDFVGGAVGGRSIVPHAPYSVSPRLFGLIADFPGNHLLTIHNQESEAENEFYRSGQGDFLRLYRAMGLDTSFFSGTGKRSLESYLPHFYGRDGHWQDGSGPNIGEVEEQRHFPPGPQRRNMILVHNVATSEEDLQFALNRRSAGGQHSPDLFFCLCPNANLYIGGELPDVELLIRSNCSIVIGTDSLASNHQLSILEELKTLQRQLPQLSTPILLEWATGNGAAALQMDGVLGSFAAGKQPGVVLVEGLDQDKFTEGSAARRLL